MSSGFTQDYRVLYIETPLGKDKLLLISLTGHEAISELFTFHLELLSEDPDIHFESIIGKNVTLSMVLHEDRERYFNGYVSHFSQVPGEGRFARYEMEVVPWLWFLTRTSDVRHFQNKTVPQIVKKVFDDFGFKDYDDSNLKNKYGEWEYCTQYRETACNFVMRLMEQEGIFFFFKHENGKHVMVMADTPAVHKPCPDQPTARYERTTGVGVKYNDDVVTSWMRKHEIRPGKIALNEFYFETPSTTLLSSIEGTVEQGGTKWEVYDYPGEYEVRDDGDEWVKLRIQEQEALYAVANGTSQCRSFSPGFRFDFTDHFRGDQNGTYVITSVSHEAHESGTLPGLSDIDAYYSNAFTCIPFSVPYKPQLVTRKPKVFGTQTAIVVGPKGEEIYVDKYGRVKVQFHWDRENNYDKHSSCWVRVSQPWAGNQWGAVYWPRIGQEVIVDFLEGDPDRPIITGRVYNAESMPPYPLPAEKTKSVIFKSDTTLGGGGFNELRIEDKKGKEQIFLHAQRNQDIRIKKDLYETIGENAHYIVGGDRLEHVDGDQHYHVKGDHNEKVDGTVSLVAGQDMQEKVGMNYALDSGMEIHLKAGMNVVIEAGLQLTIKAGGSFINISPAGIAISGMPLVLVNSGGAAGVGTGSSPDSPKEPQEADKAEAGKAAKLPPKKMRPVVKFNPSSTALKRAARTGMPFCDVMPQV